MPGGSWWMKQKTHLLAQVAISEGVGAVNSSPRSAPRRTRANDPRAPSRSTVSARSSSPAWNWKSIASRTGSPLTARIRSPATRPAAAAAVRRRTDAMTTPSAEERGFIRLLALGVGGGVEEAHARRHVLEPGGDREDRREPDHHGHSAMQTEEPREEPREHGHDLEEGRRF